jgi:hypothetical protein
VKVPPGSPTGAARSERSSPLAGHSDRLVATAFRRRIEVHGPRLWLLPSRVFETGNKSPVSPVGDQLRAPRRIGWVWPCPGRGSACRPARVVTFRSRVLRIGRMSETLDLFKAALGLGEPWRVTCLLSVVHPADVVVTENADGFCGFGRHGDADCREVTAVRDNRSRVRRHGDGRLRARKDNVGPDFRSAGSVRSA